MNFAPKETYRQVSDISLDYLMNDIEIKGLIFDFDGTLISHRTYTVETLNFIKKAKKDLNKTKYNCSFGYSYKDTSDLYEVYKKADNEMYKEKEEYHKKNGRYR